MKTKGQGCMQTVV